MSTKTTEQVKKIKPLLNFNKMNDNDLVKRLDTIHDAITGNTNFPAPTVDMTVFKTAIDLYNTLITDAMDGGKKATSAKKKQREVVIKMAIQIGHYVWSQSNNDLSIFNTSGYEAAQNVKVPLQPLDKAAIQYVDRGPTSGQVVIKPKTQKSAIGYEAHYAVVPAGSTTAPGPWTSVILPSPKAFTISNLTPGTTYQFQVRGLNKLGYSDWSDPANFICT